MKNFDNFIYSELFYVFGLFLTFVGNGAGLNTLNGREMVIRRLGLVYSLYGFVLMYVFGLSVLLLSNGAFYLNGVLLYKLVICILFVATISSQTDRFLFAPASYSAGGLFLPIIILFWCAIFVIQVDNLFYMNIILELVSFATVVLIIDSNRDSAANTAVALKYLAASAITSAFAYIGTAAIFFSTGSMSLSLLSEELIIDFKGLYTEVASGSYATNYGLLNGGLALWAIKLFFSLGVAPFHFYVIEITSVLKYQSMGAFLVLAKAPAVIIFFAFLAPLHVMFPHSQVEPAFLAVGFGSIIVTTLQLYGLTSVKKFLAVSSANSYSYLILASAIFTAKTFVTLYILVFSYNIALMSFLAVLSTSASAVVNFSHVEEKESLSEAFVKLRSLARGAISGTDKRVSIGAALCIASSMLFLITMSGFPFTPGFLGKLMIYESLLTGNYFFTCAGVALFSSLSTVGYLMAALSLGARDGHGSVNFGPKRFLTAGGDLDCSGVVFLAFFSTFGAALLVVMSLTIPSGEFIAVVVQKLSALHY